MSCLKQWRHPSGRESSLGVVVYHGIGMNLSPKPSKDLRFFGGEKREVQL